MSQPFRGIYAIVQTPFNEQGDLLWDDFQRQCDWIVRSGAHGLVWPVMASEFTVISYSERLQGTRLAVEVVGRRIPVVIGVADTSKDGAAGLAEAAGRAGADSVIALPPWATKMESHDLVDDYYAALAKASGLPVMIQNAGPPLGSSLSAKYIGELLDKVPQIEYLKEEKPPQGHAISEVINLLGQRIKGVFSGASAQWIIPEYRRGVCGNMPAAVLPDLDAQIWDLLEAGKEEEARQVHQAKMTLENALNGLPPRRARKEVLVRRGVISQPYGRNLSIEPLDEVDRQEFDRAWRVVEPYFRV